MSDGNLFELSYSARSVLLGASMLGVVGGVMGCFAILRRQSLLGDALAHAALPGVCLAFLLTQSKNTLVLFGGALVTGLIGALFILGIVRFSRIKEDAAIGMVLSVFFGVGIVLLTFIQKQPYGNQSGLDKFLFGQAATLLPRDLWVMAGLGTFVLVTVGLLYKELALLCFDADYGRSLGFPMRRLEILLTLLLVVVVVVGLQTVGVILIVATLVMPAAAARQWTERLSVMLLLAAVLGGSAGASGAILSATIPNLPTGPTIVLISSLVLLISLLAAPRRGLLHTTFAHRRLVSRIEDENLLKDLWTCGEQRGDFAVPVELAYLRGLRGQSPGRLLRVGRRLEHRGLLLLSDRGATLTPEGSDAAAKIVRKHRLWELYLTRQLELASDHVHRDADAMEHTLSEEAVERLDDKLGRPERDPHGRLIPRGGRL